MCGQGEAWRTSDFCVTASELIQSIHPFSNAVCVLTGADGKVNIVGKRGWWLDANLFERDHRRGSRPPHMKVPSEVCRSPAVFVVTICIMALHGTCSVGTSVQHKLPPIPPTLPFLSSPTCFLDLN